jgi:hypothetical protein
VVGYVFPAGCGGFALMVGGIFFITAFFFFLCTVLRQEFGLLVFASPMLSSVA